MGKKHGDTAEISCLIKRGRTTDGFCKLHRYQHNTNLLPNLSYFQAQCSSQRQSAQALLHQSCFNRNMHIKIRKFSSQLLVQCPIGTADVSFSPSPTSPSRAQLVDLFSRFQWDHAVSIGPHTPVFLCRMLLTPRS